jgi:hypothetical protein
MHLSLTTGLPPSSHGENRSGGTSEERSDLSIADWSDLWGKYR